MDDPGDSATPKWDTDTDSTVLDSDSVVSAKRPNRRPSQISLSSSMRWPLDPVLPPRFTNYRPVSGFRSTCPLPVIPFQASGSPASSARSQPEEPSEAEGALDRLLEKGSIPARWLIPEMQSIVKRRRVAAITNEDYAYAARLAGANTFLTDLQPPKQCESIEDQIADLRNTLAQETEEWERVKTEFMSEQDAKREELCDRHERESPRPSVSRQKRELAAFDENRQRGITFLMAEQRRTSRELGTQINSLGKELAAQQVVPPPRWNFGLAPRVTRDAEKEARESMMALIPGVELKRYRMKKRAPIVRKAIPGFERNGPLHDWKSDLC
jgi:hypothetical protein